MEELRREPGRSGLDVILINEWEGRDPAGEARTYCDLWGVPADKVLLDETGEYADELRIPGVPTNVFVDGQGIVRGVGASAPEELYAAADELLAS